MSTPQSGAPDPYNSGPVSGAPQPQYDPYSNPPPPQTPPPPSGPGAPPPAGPGGPFGPGGSAPVSKPPVLALGGAGAGFIGLMFLVTGVMQFLNVETEHGSGLMVVTGLYAGLTILMALGSFLGAVLCFAGTDFGRVFAAAVAGAAIWSGANVLATVIGGLAAGGSIEMRGNSWVSMVTGLLGGAAGIGVVIMMATPALSKYFAARSGKPAGGPMPGGPGVPPNGPGVLPPGAPGMPPASGPGMAPPPAGPGTPPPAGPQY